SAPAVDAIVHLSVDGPDDVSELFDAGHVHALGVEGALHLVRALAGQAAPPALYFVTSGAVPVGAPAAPIAIAQAPLRVFARVVSIEHPELWGGLVDLSRAPAAGDI